MRDLGSIRWAASVAAAVLALATVAAVAVEAGPGRGKSTGDSPPSARSSARPGSRTSTAARPSASPTTARGKATWGHRGYGGYGFPGGWYGGGWYGGWYGAFGYYDPWWGPYYPYAGWGWYAYGAPTFVLARTPSDLPGIVVTDVRPTKAELRVDGMTAGQARDFNGRWDELVLAPGTHVLEFARQGYRTLRRVVDVPPGGRIVVRDDLVRGEGSDPRSDEIPPPVEATEAEPSTPRPASAASGIVRGLLLIDASPDDAAVYLDGEPLGTAGELRRLHGALPVAVGRHVVEVVRPGYEGGRAEVEVTEDGTARLELDLSRTD